MIVKLTLLLALFWYVPGLIALVLFVASYYYTSFIMLFSAFMLIMVAGVGVAITYFMPGGQ